MADQPDIDAELGGEALPSGQTPATKEQIAADEGQSRIPDNPPHPENVGVDTGNTGDALDSILGTLDEPDDKSKTGGKEVTPKKGVSDDTSEDDGDGGGDGGSGSPGDSDESGSDSGGSGEEGGEGDDKDKPVEGDAKEKSAEEEIDEIKLPKYAKPNTTESFNKVKEIAKTKVAEATKRAEEAEAKLAEIQGKGLSDEVKKELEELREFKSKVDIEQHPKFQEYDRKLAANDKIVLGQLKKLGFSDDQLGKIRKLGGIVGVSWGSILKNLPPKDAALIERKYQESLALQADKELAVEEAKADSSKFMKSYVAEREAATGKAVDSLLPQIPALKVPELPANASKEQKENHKNAVEFVKSIHDKLKNEWIKLDSPADRAELALGTALAHVYSRQLAFTQKQLDGITEKHSAAVKERDTKITALEKELKEVKDQLDEIDKSSGTPSRRSAPRTKVRETSNQFQRADTALDAIRDSIVAE